MSRKVMVAALAAAGIVGLGSAASAAGFGLSTDQVKEAVTGNTNLDDFVIENTNGQQLQVPPSQGDVVGLINQLRGDVAKGDFVPTESKLEGGTDKLAGSVTGLASSIEQQNARLPGGKAKTADRLVASLNRTAGTLQQVPSERVNNAANVNKELSKGLLGLQLAMQRMQQLDRQNVLNTQSGDVLDNRVTEASVQDVVKKLKVMSVN